MHSIFSIIITFTDHVIHWKFELITLYNGVILRICYWWFTSLISVNLNIAVNGDFSQCTSNRVLYQRFPLIRLKYIIVNFDLVAKVIAFHSYKGGTGKTTLAVNLSANLSSKGYHVLLVDMDVYAPSFMFISIFNPRNGLMIT